MQVGRGRSPFNTLENFFFPDFCGGNIRGKGEGLGSVPYYFYSNQYLYWLVITPTKHTVVLALDNECFDTSSGHMWE
jgi:hypothetical protein